MWNLLTDLACSEVDTDLVLYRNCPICDSENSNSLYQLENFQFYSDIANQKNRITIQQNICNNCGTVYMNPTYSKNGFNILFKEAGQSYGALQHNIDNQIKWLESRDLLDKFTKIFDVGCFDGVFLSKLPQKIDKYGLDIDSAAIDRAKTLVPSGKFFKGDFENFEYDGPSPSLIVMFHVLEHVNNPKKVLNKLKDISTDGTKLVIEVPLIEGGSTNDINGFFSVQHTTHFSNLSLRTCLLATGWSISEEYLIPSYNGCRIIAEPAAPNFNYVENSSPNFNYAEVYKIMINWYNSRLNVEKKLNQISGKDRYIIWGAGIHTELIYQLTSFFHRNKKSKFLIVDNDLIKQGKTWRGIEIHHPNILNDESFQDQDLIISSYGSQNSIFKTAIELGLKRSKIVCLYDSIRQY